MIDVTVAAATAAHEKLLILLRSAMRAGTPVSVRVDQQSYMAMRADPDAFLFIDVRADGAFWRGLPIVIERPLAMEDLLIHTIEARDLRSGRTIYFNWPENPEGYR